MSGNYRPPIPGGCNALGQTLGDTFQYTFGGQSQTKYFTGCCGYDWTGGSITFSNIVLGVDQTYSGNISVLVSAEICGAGMILRATNANYWGELPDCISADIQNDGPKSLYAPYRPTSVNFTVDLFHNANSWPIAEWQVTNPTGQGAGTAPKNGHYQLEADGQSQAVGRITGTSYPVTWHFDGPPDCRFEVAADARSATLTAGTNKGTASVCIETDDADAQGLCVVKKFFFDINGCDGSCSSSGCDNTGNHSVDVHFDLGPSRKGAQNAFLQIKSAGPGPELGTPQLLQCNFLRPELKKITNSAGWLRQVRSLDRIVDILTNSPASYTLQFYDLTSQFNFTNGLYVFTNSPFKTVTVELVDGDTNHLRVTSSAEPAPADYLWEGDGWALVKGFGLRRETKSVATLGPVRTETTIVQNAASDVEYQMAETWQTFPQGDRLINRTTGSGAATRTDSWTYDENARLQQVNLSDGSWEIYTYDAMGRQIGRYRPFLNSAPTTNGALCRFTASTYDNSVVAGSGDDATREPFTPRRVIEYALGREVSRRYTVVKPGERNDIQCTTAGAAWNAPENLVTITYLHQDALYYGQPSGIVFPDGTSESYNYLDPSYTGYQRTTVTRGNYQEEVNVDRYQRVASRITRYDYTIIGQEKNTYDERGHLTNTTYLDGTSVNQVYDCCNLQSRVDRDGTVTTFGYDYLKRQVTMTVNGITTSNVFNAHGDVLATVRFGTDGTAITNRLAAYNDAGELIRSTDALGNTTYHTNYLDADSQSVRITTFPDLTTRIETYARDGSLLSVTGSAVEGIRYEYGVEADEGAQRLFKKELKLNPDGSATLEWVKIYTDMLGNLYKSVYASADGLPAARSYYTNGRLAKQVDPDGVTTLFQYNDLGEVEYTIVDFYRDGKLHKDGTNRVNRTVSDVVQKWNGSAWIYVRRTLNYIWPTNNVDSPRLAASSETTVDGLKSWNIFWNNGVGITNTTQTTYIATNGFRIVRSVAPDGSYTLATNRYGRLLSVTRYDAGGAQLERTTYGYDAHGRQNTVTDARTGTTTFHFNDADQIVATITPAPGPGQSSQATTNCFDSLGRIGQTTLPDSTCVTNEYSLTGKLKKTYGSRTYPVEYAYDYAGRLKTMTTWTNYAGAAGAATTTWHYDPYRGFLTNKVYADGIGPSYTYTPAGRLQSRKWARGIHTIYSYNAAGDLSRLSYLDAAPAVVYSYDRLGRATAISNGTQVCALTYNAVGQLLSEAYSGGPLDGLTVSNDYDLFLRRTNLAVLQSGNPLIHQSFAYDTASRLQTVSENLIPETSHAARYSYLANSPLVENIFFTNNGTLQMTTTKAYDYLNRLSSISSASSAFSAVTFNYAYNSANQRTAVTNTDDARWIYQYDALGQVVSGKKYWSDGTPVAGQQFEYAFDDIGNRQLTRAGGDAEGVNLREAGYSVNALNQYSSRTVPGYVNVLGSATNTATVTVNDRATYRHGDYYRAELSLDNTTAARWQGVTNLGVLNNGTNADIIATNAGNVLLPRTPESFTHDADGNLSSDGLWTNTWNAENRLITTESSAGIPAAARKREQWTYLPDGRWIQRIVSTWNPNTLNYQPSTTNRFVWDGQVLLAVLDHTNGLVLSFLRGLDLSGTPQGAGGVGGLLAVSVGPTGPGVLANTTHFAAYDGNGNVSALLGANDGNVSAQYEYGPFGEVLQMTGPMAKLNPIRFSTQYADDVTGDSKYLYREYSPSSGRWKSRDSLEEEVGSVNLYSFVDNSAIDNYDVFGLQKFEFVVIKNNGSPNNYGTVNNSGVWGSPGHNFTGSENITANSASTTVTGIMHKSGHCCNTVVSDHASDEPDATNQDAGSILVFMTDADPGTYTVKLEYKGEAQVKFTKDDNGDNPSGNGQAVLKFNTNHSQVMYGRVLFPKGPLSWTDSKSGISTVITKSKEDKVFVGKYNLTLNINECQEVSVTATGNITVTDHKKIK